LVLGKSCHIFWLVTNIFYLDFYKLFFLLVFLQLIQSEERGKAPEVQELSSEAEEDDDADDEENGSGNESSGDGSSSNDDEDGGDKASSDHETSSPKVDIVGRDYVQTFAFDVIVETCIFVGYDTLSK
jgi:hypothetical protein